MLAEYERWNWLHDFANSTFLGGLSYNWGVFLIATALTILAFLTMVFSVTVFALIQKFVMSWRWAAQRWSRWRSTSTAGPELRRTGTPWRPSTTR